MDFVENYMVPELENEVNSIKYQCLLQMHDFGLEDNFFDQITKAMDRSSCTVIVLSKNSIETQWNHQE